MQQSNENENGPESNDEIEQKQKILRDAKIEVTQDLFKTILERCKEDYLKLRGFKKFGEAQSNSEGVIEGFVTTYQGDMEKTAKTRNMIIKFGIEKMVNAERTAEQQSIAKIDEFQKYVKQMYRKIERARDKGETPIDQYPKDEKDLMSKIVILKELLLETEIKLQSALQVAKLEFFGDEGKKVLEMIDYTSKFIGEQIVPEIKNNFLEKIQSELPSEHKAFEDECEQQGEG